MEKLQQGTLVEILDGQHTGEPAVYIRQVGDNEHELMTLDWIKGFKREQFKVGDKVTIAKYTVAKYCSV